MVVRELIAKIAYELDKNSVNKADNSINKTKSKLSKIANVGSNAWNKISNSEKKPFIHQNNLEEWEHIKISWGVGMVLMVNI